MAARKLSTRERIIIALGVAVMLSIIIVPLSRGLANNYREGRAELKQATNRLHDAAQLRQAIEEARAAQEMIAKQMGRDQRFSLYDFTQSALTRAGLGDRMRLEKRGAASQYMEVVSVSLSGVGLKELTDFLHSMYGAGRPVAMQQLDFMRPSRDGEGIDCAMTLMSPRL